MKFQRTMARLMSDVFRATYTAATSAQHAHTQRLDATGKPPVSASSGDNNNVEKLLSELLTQVRHGTLPMGTLGNQQRQSDNNGATGLRSESTL